MPEHGMRTFTGDKQWLILGLVQEQMTPAERAEVQAHMPPPLVAFWITTGKALFDGFAAELRT